MHAHVRGKAEFLRYSFEANALDSLSWCVTRQPVPPEAARLCVNVPGMPKEKIVREVSERTLSSGTSVCITRRSYLWFERAGVFQRRDMQ